MIYAIGDIHGQKAMLDRALTLIEADGGTDSQIVFLGDYTDRGPDSRGVLDTLIAGRDAGRRWTFVKGNHDRSFYHFVQFARQHDPKVKSKINWLNPRLGGTNTLKSYGIISDQDPIFHQAGGTEEILQEWMINGQNHTAEQISKLARHSVPKQHLDFLDTCQLTYETEDLLFVHAGLRPGVPMDKQDTEDLLWIRDGWLEDKRDHGKLVAHGHTALDHPQHHGNRVNLDGGAGYGRPLHPAVFEGRDCWLLSPSGRIPLKP